VKRKAPPRCLDVPQSQYSSAVFSFNPWGFVALSMDFERERNERERGALIR